jgi:transposase
MREDLALPALEERTEREIQAAAYYAQGKRLEDIAKIMRTTKEGARYLSKRGGATMRPRGRPPG